MFKNTGQYKYKKWNNLLFVINQIEDLTLLREIVDLKLS